MQSIDKFLNEVWQRIPKGLHKHQVTARMYAPKEIVDAVNRGLNEAFGDSGDNLSRELSPNGRRPWTYKSGNYAAISLDHLRRALEVFSQNPGSVCVLAARDNEGDKEIVGVFGASGDHLLGATETWRSSAEKLLGITSSDEFYWALDENPVDLMLQSVITLEAADAEGSLIRSIYTPWLDIAAAIEYSPELLYEFSSNPRKFEEFLAATYDRAGFEVVLTPRSADRGRDVVATKKGHGSIRILDQAKAYKVGHLVTHNDVRAMIGALTTNPNSSKGIITTTSAFQPRIAESPEFKPFMPFKLELVDGAALRAWVANLAKEV